MGVYIPNMSKPKDSCWNCKAQYNSVCSLKREHIRFDGILDDCPLIEIGDIQYKAFLEFNEKLRRNLKSISYTEKGEPMKLISSGEIRSRILKAIKGEEFCGGEKCLFYHECVADKRDTDCEEFITELLEKGFRRADE